MNQLVVKEDFASKVKRWVLLDSQLKMINENVLKELKPDLIITQSQCDVCAVSLGDVELLLKKK